MIDRLATLERLLRVRQGRTRRGSVLLMVLIFSTVLFLIIFSSIRLTLFNLRMVDRSHSYKQAMAVTEAGFEYAIHEINVGNVSGNNWTDTQTVNNSSGDPFG